MGYGPATHVPLTSSQTGVIPLQTAHVPLFPHALTEFPGWHVVPSQHPGRVHGAVHRVPVLPHALVEFPGWQTPATASSQHPLAQGVPPEHAVQDLFVHRHAAHATPPVPHRLSVFPVWQLP